MRIDQSTNQPINRSANPQGLSTASASARLAEAGPNALPAARPDPLWRRFLRQFASPLIYILLAALAFDLVLWITEDFAGWPLEGMAIGLILIINAGLSLYQERRSEAALARLKAMTAAQAWVLRDGAFQRVPSEHIVPADIVKLEAGDRIPADGLLRETSGVMIDESLLTGESIPVDKGQDAEVFSGTLVVRGKALLEVTRTGAASSMGRLASMMESIEAGRTPLEKRVDRLGRQIARWVLLLAGTLGVLGVIAEGLDRASEIVVFAVALAVAAVPEGLPAVLTVALALGVERMARHNAVVRRLSAVEALGSVTVIATDKTGTLTENRMDVRSLDVTDRDRALWAIVLANDADVASASGDPLELGLLRYAEAAGVDAAALRASHPRVADTPFDSAWKFSRVTVTEDGSPVSYLKGAPEALIARCRMPKAECDSWTEKAAAYANEGFRVLAIGWAEGERDDDVILLGFALFWDPPRAEVPEAVRKAMDAGIRVLMITGDHPATALAVARQIGIPGERVLTGEDLSDRDDRALSEALDEVNVFARVKPEQKVRLVEALQARREIVAMTGDGINDAAALKRSDVGLAMGQRGSDVSREVSDLVLQDDNFATIVRAIEEGRSIYENIQKFLRFLFSTNLSEVIFVAAGTILAFALALRDESGALLVPLTAAQILWINLITDSLPALALAFDRTPGVMQQPPRPPDSPLLDRHSRRFVVLVGAMNAGVALVLIGLVPRLGFDLDEARATSFHYLAIAQLMATYAARHTAMRPLGNRYVHLAVGGGIAVQVAAGLLPATAGLLGRAALPPVLWVIVFGCAIAAWALAEIGARAIWRATSPAGQA
jgi:Ca2+-transporting ATPase